MIINKIYFDTNVVLDIIDSNRLNHKLAKKLWEVLVIRKCEIFISEDMLSTIFYISKDHKYTLDFFKLIQKRWQIVHFGKDIIKSAVDLSLEENLDLEDALQCLCAKENGCKILITNDKNFYDCGVTIYTASEFLDKYNLA